MKNGGYDQRLKWLNTPTLIERKGEKFFFLIKLSTATLDCFTPEVNFGAAVVWQRFKIVIVNWVFPQLVRSVNINRIWRHVVLLSQAKSRSDLLKVLEQYVKNLKEAAVKTASIELSRFLHDRRPIDDKKKTVDLKDVEAVLLNVTCICHKIDGKQQQKPYCDRCLEEFLLYFVKNSLKQLYVLIDKVGIILNVNRISSTLRG